MKHVITTIAENIFGNPIYNNVIVDFDATTDIKEVHERIMRESVSVGCPAILSFKAIDGDEYAAMVLRPALAEHKRLREEVLIRLRHAVQCENELSENPDMEASRREFLASIAKGYRAFISNAHDALALAGIDVDDNASKRRICNNLGLYR